LKNFKNLDHTLANRLQRHLYNVIEHEKDIYITRAHKISDFTYENDEINQFNKISDFAPLSEITLLKNFTYNYKFKKALFLIIGKDTSLWKLFYHS
jgi:hypothetical protein